MLLLGHIIKLKAYHLKKIIFTLVVCIASFNARAQVGYNYSQYDFGVGGGYNKTKTDFAKSTGKYSFYANFTYNQTPFVNFIAELNVGSLNGSDLTKVIPETAYSFTSDFTTIGFRAQLQMDEIMDYSHSQCSNFVKNIYISICRKEICVSGI